MSEDVPRVTRLAWEAVIPVKCGLSVGTRSSVQWPAGHKDPYFMVPRQGYVFFSAQPLLRAFQPLIARLGDKALMWLTFTTADGREVPVPWQYPFGVVVDRLAHAARVDSGRDLYKFSDDPSQRAHSEGVVALTAHFLTSGEAPNDDVQRLPVDTLEQAGARLLNQLLKGAIISVYRESKGFVELAVGSHNQLLVASKSNDPHGFHAARAALLHSCRRQWRKAHRPDVPRGEPDAGTDGPTAVAFRFHRADRSWPVLCDTAQQATLGALLRHVAPGLDLPPGFATGLRPLEPPFGRAFVLGSEPALATPTAYLGDHLSSPDLCVHVVLRLGDEVAAPLAPKPAPPKPARPAPSKSMDIDHDEI